MYLDAPRFLEIERKIRFLDFSIEQDRMRKSSLSANRALGLDLSFPSNPLHNFTSENEQTDYLVIIHVPSPQAHSRPRARLRIGFPPVHSPLPCPTKTVLHLKPQIRPPFYAHRRAFRAPPDIAKWQTSQLSCLQPVATRARGKYHHRSSTQSSPTRPHYKNARLPETLSAKYPCSTKPTSDYKPPGRTPCEVGTALQVTWAQPKWSNR
ncbi:hypothetical protein EI94DRAFT_1338588 [Lactarius quietus]|nr:hypothetical protein EI94DRAFT_1338588 [Lactarius quietus]